MGSGPVPHLWAALIKFTIRSSVKWLSAQLYIPLNEKQSVDVDVIQLMDGVAKEVR